MVLGSEQDRELDAAFHDLRELKVDVAYPLLLELYSDYASRSSDQAGVPAGSAVGRELRLPPGDLRHPNELHEQDLRVRSVSR